MDADIEGGLLSIGLGSDDDDETQETQSPAQREEERTGQTEEQFQQVRQKYRPKLENGEVSAPISHS